MRSVIETQIISHFSKILQQFDRSPEATGLEHGAIGL